MSRFHWCAQFGLGLLRMAFCGLASHNRIWDAYNEFLLKLSEEAKKLGYHDGDYSQLSITEYIYLATDPDAFFHIISKDKGFDPLIEHLRERKVFSVRSETIGEIPIIRASTAKTPKERMGLVVDRLKSGTHDLGHCLP